MGTPAAVQQKELKKWTDIVTVLREVRDEVKAYSGYCETYSFCTDLFWQLL